jgi:TPR repeat protein
MEAAMIARFTDCPQSNPAFRECVEVIGGNRMEFLKFSAAMLLASVWFFTGPNFLPDLNAETPSSESKKPTDLASLRQRAQQGDAVSAWLVCRTYVTGSDVPQDYQEAVKWCGQAAAENLADAQFLLGFLYEHGDGENRDYKTAISYYTAAAQQGHAIAQNNLAVMYELGHGTRRDVAQAEHWYRAAAEQSVVSAQCNLASLEFRKKDYPRAIAWFREAAQRGDATAQEDLAWMYYTGTGVPRDYSEAAKWVRPAAEQGFARAQLDLAFLYEQGKGVPQDYISAFVWYKAAEEGGQKQARAQLKTVSHLMTPRQIRAAMEKAASSPRSSGMDGAAESIGAPFDDLATGRTNDPRQLDSSGRVTKTERH